MPPEAPDAAARWQALADETRVAAEEVTDPQARLILLTIARAYERLAQRASERQSQSPED